mmetsp:Transcript_6676/g.19556  ORF Transcript_6676/g.19556 Transcript_6676/m.19556 type:complete len:296 (+) Transcript_6676:322-1209(+)
MAWDGGNDPVAVEGDEEEDVSLLVEGGGALSVEAGKSSLGEDVHPPIIYSLIVFTSAFFAALQYCIVLPSLLSYAEDDLDGPFSPAMTAGLIVGGADLVSIAVTPVLPFLSFKTVFAVQAVLGFVGSVRLRGPVQIPVDGDRGENRRGLRLLVQLHLPQLYWELRGGSAPHDVPLHSLLLGLHRSRFGSDGWGHAGLIWRGGGSGPPSLEREDRSGVRDGRRFLPLSLHGAGRASISEECLGDRRGGVEGKGEEGKAEARSHSRGGADNVARVPGWKLRAGDHHNRRGGVGVQRD